MNKNELRDDVKKKRKALTHNEITEKSEKITSYLLSTEQYIKSEIICIYIAAFNEVRTIPIINHALTCGKKVCVPISDASTNTLSLSYITSIGDLVPSTFGIYEPSKIIPAQEHLVDLIVVPGIAFDRRGMRIGFGRGFYDRFLCASDAAKIGLCYNFQLVDGIAGEEHDIPMDIIITEEEICICQNR